MNALFLKDLADKTRRGLDQPRSRTNQMGIPTQRARDDMTGCAMTLITRQRACAEARFQRHHDVGQDPSVRQVCLHWRICNHRLLTAIDPRY